MALFGQKTETFKVDNIVNNHLRKLLETPVARKTAEETPVPEAIFAVAEPATAIPAASDATFVSYVDESVVVATEEPAPIFEPTPEVVVEPIVAEIVAEEVVQVAVYVADDRFQGAKAS